MSRSARAVRGRVALASNVAAMRAGMSRCRGGHARAVGGGLRHLDRSDDRRESDEAPRPIATYLLIIGVPLEASRSTLGLRTSSLCASHAELKMNVRLATVHLKSALDIVAYAAYRGSDPMTAPILKTRADSSTSHSGNCGSTAGERHSVFKHYPLPCAAASGQGTSRCRVRGRTRNGDEGS